MPGSEAPSRERAAARRGPRKVTAKSLENMALFYLERHASSVANFRQVLMRKVARSVRAHDTDAEAGAALVEALIARYRRVGLLDDRAYALGRVASRHRQGDSVRAIRAKLRAKGVADDDIAAALAALARDVGAAAPGALDLRAACAYARRRRLGPWRPEDERPARRERDLAALARAGFGYDTARRVIEVDSVAALAAMIDEAATGADLT